MIDPIQSQIAAAPPAPSSTPAPLSTASSASPDIGGPADLKKGAAASSAGGTPSNAAQAAGSGGSNESQSTSEAAQPLRLLIEHDKTTNHYVYKLYDSSGRIVREIPQESLAEAQKQASGATGVVIDTKA